MPRIILSLILAFLLCNTGFSQSVLEGIVVDDLAKQPLEFSTLALHHANDSTYVTSTLSDASGRFVLKDVQPGNYYLKVQFLGYEPAKVSNLQVSQNQKLNVGTIGLALNPAVLNEITVKGEKVNAIHQIDKQIYSASQFQSAKGGTATDVLRNLPSVSVNSEGDITMRGSSSFIVLLDGKPTQSDPSTILNQLPANIVENIEVITTPSSKFDPDGKAGIINITTKKGATDGSYFLFNVQGGLPSVQDYGNVNKPVRYAGDVTSNFRKDKLSVSLSANYKRDDIAGYRDGEAKTYINNIYTTFPSHGERSYRIYNYSVKGVANYQFNKKNIIEGGFYAGKRSEFREADILYKQQRINETSGEVLNSFNYYNKNLRERRGDFIVANLDYYHIFENKSNVTVSALYEKTILGGPTKNKNVNPEDQSQLYNNAVMEESNPLDGVRLKADYVLPVKEKGKFETGYQYRYLLHRGDFTYNQFDTETNSWFIRPDLSNGVKLTRNIHSVYSQYSDVAGKLSYTAGLRLEYVDRVLKDNSTLAPYTFNKLNLFPSVNLLYPVSRGYKLKAGYSKRIAHTTSNMMNPFPARRHSETLEIGDPKLLPEYIDVAELGAVKDFSNSSVFANLYYRGTKNVINRVNAIYNDTILTRTYTNAGNAKAYGLEVGVDLKPASWLTIFAGGNVCEYSIKGSVFNANVNTHSVNYSFNTNTTFKITSSLSFQLSINYTSRTVTAQGDDSRFLIPTATLKKNILKDQGSISLQWQNIDTGLLGTNQQRITTSTSAFYTSTNYIKEVDIFRINFSYQLNKLAKKLKFTESEFGDKEF